MNSMTNLGLTQVQKQQQARYSFLMAQLQSRRDEKYRGLKMAPMSDSGGLPKHLVGRVTLEGVGEPPPPKVCRACSRAFLATWVNLFHDPTTHECYGVWNETDLTVEGLCAACLYDKDMRELRQQRRRTDAMRCAQIFDESPDPDRRRAMDNYRLEWFVPSTKEQEDALSHVRTATSLATEGKRMPGLFMTGKYGCGKTHLAVALCRELWKMGVGALVLEEPEYIELVKQSYDNGGSYAASRAAEIEQLAKRVEVLVLDDLGRGRLKPDRSDAESPTSNEWYRSSVLYPILNTRWRNSLPVIVTTNRARPWLEKHIGGANASRLRALCPIDVPMRGPDLRNIEEA